jgi:hypothetical protein
MADGPDPNRFDPIDNEMDPSSYKHGDSLGDLRSTRLGLPTWAVAIVLVAVFILFLVLTR